MAHSGIAHPEIWKRWRNAAGEDAAKIAFAIQANRKSELAYKHSGRFVEESRIDIPQKTSWGKLSVVLAEQRSFKNILDSYPRAERIYVISGL